MRFREIFRFGLAGGLNTLVTFAAYALLVAGGVAYVVANALAWTIGIVCAYFLSLIFVFRAKQPIGTGARRFVLFATLHITSFALSSLLLIGLVESGLLEPVRAQLVVIPFIAIFNFVSSKVLVFRSGESR
jgi:putative flippase GtrA